MADKGLRKWVYQARAYEVDKDLETLVRNTKYEIRGCIYIYIYMYAHIYIYMYI